MEVESKTYKVLELMDLKRNGMLSVNPEYQRGAVWAEAQQKKLIDSVLRGYPLPLIYLHNKRRVIAGLVNESLEIIDGQQRIDALYKFIEGGFKLFDPVKDEKNARFPIFIKKLPCEWGNKDIHNLPSTLREKFESTELNVVKITTDSEDEARDLFIRLQSGLPLNPQEKRDAWPGGFTEFVLKFGGKKGIVRYPGHDFFTKIVKTKSKDRGEARSLCAQIGMLFFEEANKGNWLDISTQAIDDYYYRYLDFQLRSKPVERFTKVLDTIVEIFQQFSGPKLKAHEAIHVVLLVESLLDDYVRTSWEKNFIRAFDTFRYNVTNDTRRGSGPFWYEYSALTRAQSTEGKSLQRRHQFFATQMFNLLKPEKLDNNRAFGQLERELIYYRNNKSCAVCNLEVNWDDLHIHHVKEHHKGGTTSLNNAVPVHDKCHPKGENADVFYHDWVKSNQSIVRPEDVQVPLVGFEL